VLRRAAGELKGADDMGPNRWSVAGGTRALVLGVLVLVVAGCVAPAPPPPPPVGPLPAYLDAVALTRDGDGQYGVTVAGGTMTVTGAAVDGSNTRVIVWPAAATPTLDQTVCSTWTDQSSVVNQQGVALRIHTAAGATRAVTVTKNVWFAVSRIFNVHVWDTSQPAVGAVLGQFDLGETFQMPYQAPKPLPWRLCARVQGSTLDFIAWPLTTTEPAWGDPGRGGSVTLPPGWDTPGVTGWYAGHLSPGEHLTIGDLVPALTPAP
jgi:hypothetical protein